MRETVGSTFLFNIMIIFIFFFVAFLAIAINYSQAFRIKNQVINYIEQYEGINDGNAERIISYLNRAGYYRDSVSCDCEGGNNFTCAGDRGSNLSAEGISSHGLCIKKLEINDGSGDAYYKVTTFVSFNIPIIGTFFTLPVVGETKKITNDSY